MKTTLLSLRSLITIVIGSLLSLCMVSCLNDDDGPNYPTGAEELVGDYTGEMTIHLPSKDSLLKVELRLDETLHLYPMPIARVLDSISVTMPMTPEQHEYKELLLGSVALYSTYTISNIDANLVGVNIPPSVTDIRLDTKEGWRTVRLSLSADEPLTYHRDTKSIDVRLRFHDAMVNGERAEHFRDITMEGTLRSVKASN